MNQTTEKLNVSYHIEVLGRLWMPTCLAAQKLDIRQGKKAFDVDIDPSREMEDLADYVNTHTGDFSEVVDYKIVKRFQTRDVYTSDARECLRTHHETLVDWTSERNELSFMDCMYPSED